MLTHRIHSVIGKAPSWAEVAFCRALVCSIFPRATLNLLRFIGIHSVALAGTGAIVAASELMEPAKLALFTHALTLTVLKGAWSTRDFCGVVGVVSVARRGAVTIGIAIHDVVAESSRVTSLAFAITLSGRICPSCASHLFASCCISCVSR